MTTPEETLAAIAQLTLITAAMAEHAENIAYARRCHYLAYLDQGFTEEQALELCKVITLT